MDSVVSIIIPAFNEVDYCRQCVATVRTNTRPPYRLILVDNGSTDGAGEYFDSVDGAIVIHAESNRGFAGGVNLGLARAEGHVVILNSDTLVPEGWLTRLEAALCKSPDIGMAGPVSNYVSGDQLIEGLTFHSMGEINDFALNLAQKLAGKVRNTKRLVGFCLMIRDSVYQEIGPFDESFRTGNFEDDDYCLRVLRAGYRLCIADDCFVFHYGNRTFLGMGITGARWDALLSENMDRFYRKWNVQPIQRHDAVQRAKALNDQARQARNRGDSAQALKLLTEALEVCPLLELNYNDLGVVLWEMNERERAYELFVRAVELNPSYRDARDNLHDAAEALGKLDEIGNLLGEH